jgi:hypothetical protein
MRQEYNENLRAKADKSQLADNLQIVNIDAVEVDQIHKKLTNLNIFEKQ